MRRRAWLLAGAGTAGALIVGIGLLPPRSRLGAATLLAGPDGVALNGWIRIAADGAVQLAMPRAEMGQGVHTALAMLVAEELDVALAAVQLVPAGHDAIYGNVQMLRAALPRHPRAVEAGRESPLVEASDAVLQRAGRVLGLNATVGSTTLADLWLPLRLAAATARAKLLGAASLAWKLPVAELSCRDGVIRHASGPSAGFAELAERAAITPASDVRPKPRAQWRLIGTPAPRTDGPAKVDGRAGYGIDTRLPGQVYAVIRQAPTIGGSPGAVDVAPALATDGVERVVRLPPLAGAPAALAVVGRTTWHALRGAQALKVEWRPRPAGALDSGVIRRALADRARAGGGFVFHAQGNAEAALAAAAQRVEALYEAPYLAHLTMEPLNCTARVEAGRVELWAPTQVPGLARAVAAQVAGVAESEVTVHVPLLGGGFGRRLEVDVVAQAVRIALETGGRPVQLVWPRDEDLAHDFYRPAAAAWLRAGLDAQGRLVALAIDSAGDAVAPRWAGRVRPFGGASGAAGLLPDKTTAEGLADLPYAVPHQRIAHAATSMGVPVGFWRAVGHSHNAFFGEGFVDELAHAAGADPVAFRRTLLEDMPRHRAVLDLAATRAGWGTPTPPGQARGVALHESFGSIVALVLEVSLGAAGPRVHRAVAAVDCGTVVNPDGVAQQLESGVMFGLAAALRGRMDIEAGAVRQKNLHDLPPLSLAETPVIETHLVPSEREPTGMGEPGLPPVAPALASALFALTGVRHRSLPLVR